MLISLIQIQQFKSITSNIDTVKSLEPYIQEAEEFDLRAFLGEELYIALVEDFEASPSLEVYPDLYNGSSYEYAGKTYKHEGLIPVLAYFTYARYVANANSHSTKYGIMQKKNEFSEAVSEKTIARLVSQAKSGAIVYQDRVKRYLNHHADTIPLWVCGIGRRKSQIRISGVGGTSTDRKGKK